LTVQFKEKPSGLKEHELFLWKKTQELEEKKIRAKLEKAYEQEKQKSVIMKKCNRVYHELLKATDTKLYLHLMRNQVSPELQLMRWLRCLLSREFPIAHTLVLWDYIFGGIEPTHRARSRVNDFL